MNSRLPSTLFLQVTSVQTLPPCGIAAWNLISLVLILVFSVSFLPFTITLLTDRQACMKLCGNHGSLPFRAWSSFFPSWVRPMVNKTYWRAWHRSSWEREDLVLALQKLKLWLEKFYIQAVFNFVTFIQPHFQVRHWYFRILFQSLNLVFNATLLSDFELWRHFTSCQLVLLKNKGLAFAKMVGYVCDNRAMPVTWLCSSEITVAPGLPPKCQAVA